MDKTRTTPKKKESIVMLDLDADVVDAIEDIAEMAGVTPTDVVSVMLSTKIYNERQYREHVAKKRKRNAVKSRMHIGAISLGDK